MIRSSHKNSNREGKKSVSKRQNATAHSPTTATCPAAWK